MIKDKEKERLREIRKRMEERVLEFVRNREYRKAFEVKHEYNVKYNPFYSSTSHESSFLITDKEKLWRILEPEIQILEALTYKEDYNIPQEEFLALKQEAIWRWMLQKKFRKRPRKFWADVYNSLFNYSREKVLEEKRKLGTKYVRVLAAPDACEACKQLERNGPYPIDQAPRPQDYCTRDWCRCVYLSEE